MATNTMVVEGAFTIENVANIQEQMRSVLSRCEEGRGVPVDVGAVTEFDGAALQLLVIFSKAIQKAGSEIELVNAPEIMRNVLTDFGINIKLSDEVKA